MKKTYRAGEQVSYGVYVSTKPVNMHYMSADEELPGTDETTYRRLPTLLVAAASPAIGGIFVMTFPLIILAGVAVALGKFTKQTVQRMATNKAHLVQMNWQPTAAYLDGDGKEQTPSAEAVKDESVETLKAEVDSRREEERT